MSKTLLDIKIKSTENFQKTSDKIGIIGGKKYECSTQVCGLQGNGFSAYFGAVILDNKEREITRKILWLEDFSSSQKKYSVVFSTPKDGYFVKIIYRINQETPVKSDCHYSLMPIEEIVCKEANEFTKENLQKI